MIDLHTHTLLSDGALLPSELIRYCLVKGYKGVAITDHVDESNVDFIVPRVIKICRKLNAPAKIKVVPGVELTHVPPKDFPKLVKYVRAKGIKLVLIHGETLVEPVAPGTNKKALQCEINILTHPGLITEEEAGLAARKGIYLEITTRKGHCLTNGHVAKIARKTGAPLVLNTDSHAPEDLVSATQAENIARGAGLTEDEVRALFKNSERILSRI